MPIKPFDITLPFARFIRAMFSLFGERKTGQRELKLITAVIAPPIIVTKEKRNETAMPADF